MFALKGNELLYYNVGNGKPFTVLEIVAVVRKVTGKPVPVTLQPQRPGDPAILYTDPAKIMFEIGTPLWHRTPSPGTSVPPPLGPLSVRSPGAKRGARPTLVTWTRPSSEDLLTTVRAVHRLAATLHRHRDDGPPWLGVASGPLRVVSCALR